MKIILQSVRIFAIFTILLGFLYPALITVVAQGGFATEANGSLVTRKGRLVGSRLIGQGFKSPRYFWSRPSAVDHNPLPSGGSNASGTSQSLREKVKERAAAGGAGELLYASASGLDPHVSPAAAMAQVNRVAAARHLDAAGTERLANLVSRATEARYAGFLGDPVVNVLELNLAVDETFGN